MFAMREKSACPDMESSEKCKDCNDFCQQACDLLSSLVLNCDSQDKTYPDIPHACAACPKSFTSDAHLRDHVHREHKESLNLVPLDRIYQLLGLRVEEKTDAASRAKRRPYACTTCKKRYKSKNKLARHVRRSHADKSPAKIKDPHKSSGSRVSRKEPSSNKLPKKDIHQERKFVHTHGNTRRSDENAAQVSHLCEVCGRTNKSSRLDSKSCSCGGVSKSREEAPSRREAESSSGSKDVTSEGGRCTICNKSFKNKRGLAIHMAWERKEMRRAERMRTVVTGDRPRGESFGGVLWAHQEEVEVDAGRKSHKCSECGKSFDSVRAVLNHFRHMHEHEDSEQSYESEDGLYHCRRCKVTCLNKDDMQLHGVQHRTCKRCEKTFSSINALKTHTSRVHRFKRGDGIFLFSCSGCSASFRSKKTLMLHRVMTKHRTGRPSIKRVASQPQCETEMSQDNRAGAEKLQELRNDNSMSQKKTVEYSSTTDHANVDSKAWYW